MDRRNVLKMVGIIGVGGAVSGCLGMGDRVDAEDLAEGVNKTIFEEEMAETLRILESSLYRDPDQFGVHGTVKNVGDRPFLNVEVHVRLLDTDDEIIGEFYDDQPRNDEVWQLDPGEAEDFNVEFPDTEPEDVERAVLYEIWATGDRPT